MTLEIVRCGYVLSNTTLHRTYCMRNIDVSELF